MDISNNLINVVGSVKGGILCSVTKRRLSFRLILLLLVIYGFSGSGVYAEPCLLDTNADGDADTNVDTVSGATTNIDMGTACGSGATASGTSSTALGENARATGDFSSALGRTATATGNGSTALGLNARASGLRSTALGVSATASGEYATAMGSQAFTSGKFSTALGWAASAASAGAVSLGYSAGNINAIPVSNSRQAIAIGYRSIIAPSSAGAIAIGGDVNGDNKGAQANAPGAIAIGADVVATKANTMRVGVPIEIIRDDGTTQILVNEKRAGNDVHTLLNLRCDSCTPGFRFSQLLPTNQTWDFRMLQSGAFSVDDPSSPVKEAEFRFGGDLKIGGSLIESSSRHVKKNIIEVNTTDILEKLDLLSIHKWSYNHNPDRIRHMGPMAEDFHALFGLGDTNKGISSIDTTGVALAAIKALKHENDMLKNENQILISRLEAIESQISQIKEFK